MTPGRLSDEQVAGYYDPIRLKQALTCNRVKEKQHVSEWWGDVCRGHFREIGSFKESN